MHSWKVNFRVPYSILLSHNNLINRYVFTWIRFIIRGQRKFIESGELETLLACCLLFCAYAIVPSNFFSFSSCQSLTLSFWTNIPPLVTITTRASFDLQLVKFTILQFYSNIISWFTTLIEEVLRFVLASVFPRQI